MTPTQGIFLFSVAIAAGALNSVAAGGGFLAFPALLFTGMPPINANATNTAAMWPGTAASVAAYRNEITGHRRIFVPLMITGIIGGLAGSIILLRMRQTTFMNMVPWLLLVATLIFIFSARITRSIGLITGESETPSRTVVLTSALIQLGVGLYIGFFGAGAGILMMALFAIMGVRSIHSINGLKTLLATITNGMALLIFIFAKAIIWPQALLMIVGATIGGYGGAWYAQKLPARYVRWFAIAVGVSMTVYFFIRTEGSWAWALAVLSHLKIG
jgi:uncharacterized protein